MGWFDENNFLAGDQVQSQQGIMAGEPNPNTPQQGVVYTDPSGRGYNPSELSQAWGSGALGGDPLNARVPDILAQYGMGGGQPKISPMPAVPMGNGGGFSGASGAPQFSQALSLGQMANPTPYTLPTQAEVEQTPGYQFTRDQGIRGVQSSAIARGAGLGGAALKELGQYTTGLADQYYGNRVQQGMAANNLNFGQGLQTNQYNSGNKLNEFNAGLNAFGANQQAQNQFWTQGFNENRNAFDQYRSSQNDAFDQWYKLAELGNPGNPYT